jgi:menaquinone-9 beta-reductase
MVVLGGGLAGTAAAIAARLAGAPVTLVEKSAFPRHKVCGEFLSPEILPILAELQLDQAFLALQPALMRRAVLNFGAKGEKRFALPEPAYGLSRYALDAFLIQHAQQLGVDLTKETTAKPDVIATGRGALPSVGATPKGNRLFGFKAHFAGQANDAVELYFFPGGYVGVNPVENGITNVCGLCSEALLKNHDFSVDALIAQLPALRNRLAPLKRQWDWLFVGPLIFENRLNARVDAFYAGDAVSFVDPFTGSGMLSALYSGLLAGRYCAQGKTPQQYHQAVKTVLERPFAISSFLRRAVWTGWAVRLAPLAPGRVLFWATRPRKFVQK